MSKNYLGIIIILICLFLFSPQNTYSSSIMEDYELQEKCGKRCQEFFKETYGDGNLKTDEGQMTVNYINHYNKKLNKCFILISFTSYFKDKKMEKTGTISMENLLDVNENKEYGSISIIRNQPNASFTCNFNDKSCNSRKEWDSLVKPYMEE